MDSFSLTQSSAAKKLAQAAIVQIDTKFTENTVPPPVVTVPDNVNEGAVLPIVIADFNPTTAYQISGTLGEFTYTGGNTAICKVRDVDEDTTGTIVISGIRAGMLQSEDAVTTVNIIYVPIVADGILSNSDFATFADTNNGFEY